MPDQHNLPRAIIEATVSPYPASFDGSTIRFQLALFALMSIAIVGGMIGTWMGRELVRGRKDAFPWEPLFAIRLIFFCCGLGAVLRAGPEAAMMVTWRENADVAAQIMVIKRWCDAFTFIPAMLWMSSVFIFYPSICMGLVRIARSPGGEGVKLLLPRARILKLGKVVAYVFAISLLIAVGKRW